MERVFLTGVTGSLFNYCESVPRFPKVDDGVEIMVVKIYTLTKKRVKITVMLFCLKTIKIG